MGTDARVVEALESWAKWRTNEFTSIEPHRHGERYIRIIQLKKKKTVTQALTNHISSHLWRRKFQHSQNPLLNMTDLKRRARWILLKANPVRSEWRMWSKRKKHKRSIGAHLDTVSFCQDVPECVLKLGEIHLMASSQQRLGWTGTNQTEYFLNDAWTTTS